MGEQTFIYATRAGIAEPGIYLRESVSPARSSFTGNAMYAEAAADLSVLIKNLLISDEIDVVIDAFSTHFSSASGVLFIVLNASSS